MKDVALPRPEIVDRIVDDALRFANVHRNASAWTEWAQKLAPEKRAVFEAIRANVPQEGASDSPEDQRPELGVPTLRALSHELRNMLNGAYAIWDSGQQ